MRWFSGLSCHRTTKGGTSHVEAHPEAPRSTPGRRVLLVASGSLSPTAPSGGRRMTSALEHGTEDTPGRLGAVLRAVGAAATRSRWAGTVRGWSRRCRQARSGPHRPGRLRLPGRREPARWSPRVEVDGRSRHAPVRAARPRRAQLAARRSCAELASSARGSRRRRSTTPCSSCAGRWHVPRWLPAPPGLDDGDRNEVADAVLGLGRRPWAGDLRTPTAAPLVTRPSRRGRGPAGLESLLGRLGDPAPARTATVLAAGTQVPIAAGAWLLVALAERPALQQQLASGVSRAESVVWEVLRLTPPTWVTARVAAVRRRPGRSPDTRGRRGAGQPVAPGSARRPRPLRRRRRRGRRGTASRRSAGRARGCARGRGCPSGLVRTLARVAAWAWRNSSALTTWAERRVLAAGRSGPAGPDPGYLSATGADRRPGT